MRICAALILAASALHHPAAHAATTAAPDSRGPRVSEISESEFAEAFARRSSYEAQADTVTSPRICGMIRKKMIERLDGMDDSDTAAIYDFRDSDSDCPVIRFPFGVLAALVYITHEEYEYWFFRESDCRFAAQTHTWPDYGGVRHCVSKDGYLATWQNRGYDSKADISVYRLGDGGVTPVARYSDVEITNWEEVCWGEDNALYVRGSYYNDEEDGPPDERAVDKCLKFTLPS